METFNEVIVLSIGIHEIVLLGFIDDYNAKEIVGNSMVFFILLMLFLNFIVVSKDFL